MARRNDVLMVFLSTLGIAGCSGDSGGDTGGAGTDTGATSVTTSTGTQGSGTDTTAGSSTTTTDGTSGSPTSATGSSGETTTDSASTGTSGSSSDGTSGGSTSGQGTGSTSGGGGSTGGTSGGSTSGGSTGGIGGTTGAGSTGGGMKMCEPVIPGNEECLAPAFHEVCDDDDDPFHALGLNCPGNASNSTPILNETFQATDASTWFTITQFGSHAEWQPKEGNRMLIMSTGQLESPDGNHVLTQAAGKTENLQLMMNPNKTDNPDEVPLPVPVSPVNGSGGTPFMDCDCVNDCSDTLEAQWELGDGEAHDIIWFRFDLQVPQGTYGYEFDFAWFSAEYPEWVDTKYNDVFLVWSSSESYTGNITFIDGQPLTVTALDAEMQYKNNAQQLQDTGFEGVGGGTGWFTALGSTKPGETFTLVWVLFDMGDEVLDTAVLLDNFRWTCMGCDPQVNGCGIIPQ